MPLIRGQLIYFIKRVRADAGVGVGHTVVVKAEQTVTQALTIITTTIDMASGIDNPSI